MRTADSKLQGVSVKGYVTLSSPSYTGGFARWTRRAESIRLESATSSNLPLERQSLEAFGQLLEGKALASWGERGEGGRLEASARYTWERRLDDGRRFMGEGSPGRQARQRGVSCQRSLCCDCVRCVQWKSEAEAMGVDIMGTESSMF